MHRRLARATTATWLAIFQLLLSLAAAADLVVCREANGTVVVESTLGGDCCLDRDEGPRVVVGPDQDDCLCVDTPFVSGAFGTPRVDGHIEVPPLVVGLHGRPPAMPCSSGRVTPSGAGPGPASRRKLQTVVLLV